MTASDVERARRRVADHEGRGESVSFESILADQRTRDAFDLAREIAPMKPADDAALIDTTGMTVEQVVEQLVDRIGCVR